MTDISRLLSYLYGYDGSGGRGRDGALCLLGQNQQQPGIYVEPEGGTMMKSDYLIPYFLRIFKSGFSMDLAQRVYP